MNASRSRARNTIDFAPVITGPTGAQIVAYTWAWKAIEVVDARGEDVVRRVSDWERAVPSESTGRDIVHQFVVRCPLGHERVLSLESALRDTGLLAEQGSPVRGALAAAQTLAKLHLMRASLRLGIEALDQAKAEVAALPRPAMPRVVSEDGWARLPDHPEIMVKCPQGLTPERLRCLLERWIDAEVRQRVSAAGGDRSEDALRAGATDIERRIARAEGKLAVATAAANPHAIGAVLNKKTHGLPDGAVYIGRPSPYGNPFAIGRDGDRAAVISKYREWLADRPALIAQAQRDLVGKALVCWCAPEACHGDVLREAVDAAARANNDTSAPATHTTATHSGEHREPKAASVRG
ncbi:hypothetical protein [Dolichospermum phage Dfl-JY45]